MEIPIEDNPDNLEEWTSSNINFDNPENNPWFENVTNEKEISELFIGDLFIVLLKDYEKPFLCKVETRSPNMVSEKLYMTLFNNTPS